MNTQISELTNLNWDKSNGLIPAVIQDSVTLQVLMLGYMTQEALALTCSSGKVTFFSRTKNRLWVKGETSGNYLTVVSISPDCDRDTLLILAIPIGNTCHLDGKSCFGDCSTTSLNILTKLENTIEQRYIEKTENSYVSQLFNSGTQRIAQKVGEEGVETALAGVAGDNYALISESADLLFHLLILLTKRRIIFLDVLNELKRRMDQ
ncbi:MAG: bifunctional phosphoribosyl-AMP cyclohydrolase/phosphoribosyl-ATP diphosphatase HisIE [Gammaproteobacteria bacterium]|nr:bifunctional phosphoribosyl-AMP cyclohydrolase/phosphoribosyl-ATP diphosphatase HisIE [Gammaproteobacteria bacterium]